MKTRTRFIRSVIATAKADETRLPWARGATRAVTKSARSGALALPKVRTA